MKNVTIAILAITLAITVLSGCKIAVKATKAGATPTPMASPLRDEQRIGKKENIPYINRHIQNMRQKVQQHEHDLSGQQK